MEKKELFEYTYPEGGQGAIYLGKHTTRYGDYVLKQFEEKEIAKNEIEVLRRLTPLNHENIVKCYNFLPGHSQKTQDTIIELEYCSNGSLRDEIKSCIENNEVFPEIQILSWLIQIVNGLEAIHSQSIIHQDIKPNNILIGSGGVIKIACFGASRILSSPDDCSRMIAGSIPYLSPEAVTKGKVSMPSDIWSLGVMAYELCCLHRPYDGKNLHKMQALLSNLHYIPAPIPKHYSKYLVDIIKSMLQKKKTTVIFQYIAK